MIPISGIFDAQRMECGLQSDSRNDAGAWCRQRPDSNERARERSGSGRCDGFASATAPSECADPRELDERMRSRAVGDLT